MRVGCQTQQEECQPVRCEGSGQHPFGLECAIYVPPEDGGNKIDGRYDIQLLCRLTHGAGEERDLIAVGCDDLSLYIYQQQSSHDQRH